MVDPRLRPKRVAHPTRNGNVSFGVFSSKWETSDLSSIGKLALLDPIWSRDLLVTVIGGMAKTGTTLPLTLLDGHPDLVVFPEEFRFFHMKAHQRDGATAAEAFLGNQNIRRLSGGKQDYGRTDYKGHGGTGFGQTDYTMFDWDLFEQLVRDGFLAHRKVIDRFRIVIGAYLAAMEQPIAGGPLHFVCKAPHNENYALQWVRMLGKHGHYIQCTRDPIEHYLSLRNMAELYELGEYGADEFARKVRRRRWLWRIYPRKRLYVLDYEKLTTDPNAETRKIADFMGIAFNEFMLHPTKNSAPWSGNSSRGLVSEAVFVNPSFARDVVSHEDQRIIESYLHRFMKRMGWRVTAR